MNSDSTTIYRVKITFRDIRPLIWRHIELKGSTSLYKLHQIIQEAFGWFDVHLHQFIVGGEYYGESVPEADFELKSARRLKLAQAAPAIGDKFLYEYDFGDGWVHEIKVEAIEQPEAGARYPRCIRGIGILERLNRTFKHESYFRHNPEAFSQLYEVTRAFKRWYNSLHKTHPSTSERLGQFLLNTLYSLGS